MKRKDAIKKLQNGQVQIFNDLLPSTKEIKKILKEAFPDDNEPHFKEMYFKRHFDNEKCWSYGRNKITEGLPIVNLSSISKGKNKLKKALSELSKDVAESKSKINNIQISISALQIWQFGNNKPKHLGSIFPSENLECGFENVKPKLEIGKWYKNESFGKFMFCFSGKYGNSHETDSNYGFDYHGIYKDKLGVHEKEDYILASQEEVSKALIEEAKKRGYNDEVGIKGFIDGEVWTKSVNIEFKYNEKENTLEMWSDVSETKHDGYIDKCRCKTDILKDGVWAEIIEKPKEEVIDWSVPQIVKSKNGIIVITNGNNTVTTFEGFGVVNGNKMTKLWKTYKKVAFNRFKGTLTINQE